MRTQRVDAASLMCYATCTLHRRLSRWASGRLVRNAQVQDLTWYTQMEYRGKG